MRQILSLFFLAAIFFLRPPDVPFFFFFSWGCDRNQRKSREPLQPRPKTLLPPPSLLAVPLKKKGSESQLGLLFF